MKIADLPPVRTFQDTNGLERVLVHVHRRDGGGPAIGKAQLHGPAAEQMVPDDCLIVVGLHFLTVHGKDGVPPLEAGRGRRRSVISIGHHRADALMGAVDIIQLKVHPEGPGVPGDAADK